MIGEVSSCIPVEAALRQHEAAEDEARIAQVEHERRVGEAELFLRRNPEVIAERADDDTFFLLVRAVLAGDLAVARDVLRREVDRQALIEAGRMERDDE